MQTLSTDNTKPGPRDPLPAGELVIDPDLTGPARTEALKEAFGWNVPEVPDYDVAGAAIQAAGVSLAAAVLIGATVIWTRPKDEEPVDAVTTPTAGAGPPPSAPTLPADPVPTTQPAPVVENDGATVEASLRRLKALHDDGILTDAEYETKRKALTDKL